MDSEPMERIEDALADMVRDAVADKLSCVRMTLSSVFATLMWQIKLECERLGGVGDIEWIIGHVIATAKYDGPEHAPYSTFDKKDPEFIARLGRVRTAMENLNIKGSW